MKPEDRRIIPTGVGRPVDVGTRFKRVASRVRLWRAQTAYRLNTAAARLRRPRDDDASWWASWGLACLRGVLVALVGAGAVLVVKVVLARIVP